MRIVFWRRRIATQDSDAKLLHRKHPDKTTEELIREIKQCENLEENFGRLFERSYGQIHRFFKRKGFSPDDGHERQAKEELSERLKPYFGEVEF